MEELSLDYILDDNQIDDLFGETEETSNEKKEEQTPDTEKTDEKKEQEEEQNNEATEVDSEDLFEDKPESVGSEENKENLEGSETAQGKNSPNFYSSIANALVAEGVFQNLDEEKVNKISSSEDLVDLFEEQVRERFDEKQRRIDEALSVGVEPDQVKQYEALLNKLDSFTDTDLTDESSEGQKLRKSLIYQDYINRGFKPERARKEVERSFKAVTDIEDAREALQGNKDYYNAQYKELIAERKEEQRKLQEEERKQSEQLRQSILDADKIFGDVDVDKTTRRRAYDAVMKPSYTDPDTGQRYTELQHYSNENRIEFLKNVGLLYVITDGFKNLDKLVKGKVKKEVKKGFKDLEKTLSGGSNVNTGSLKFASGVTSDPESKILKWNLDI